jgi:uncharacterized protein YdeI (YjbR/CyaY-like superfamily)
MIAKNDCEIMAFPSVKNWERWLAANHAKSSGVWLRFFKKSSSTASVTHAQALDEALCYGWIDGQLKSHDSTSWLHKFLPRRPKSIWSKRNQEHVARLTKAGKMRPAGLQEVNAAKADGRWDMAYDSPSSMKIPADFLRALSKDKGAKKFFATLNKANIYSITWRLQTAKKPETRGKRMKSILAMLSEGKKFHG